MNRSQSPLTLLAVFAHPDDETFGPGGTLARYAHEGVPVHLICATRGEAGENNVGTLGDCPDLACKREEELRCAARILGLAGVHLLDYRDSGMPGSPHNSHPRALTRADLRAVATQIAERLVALRPQVVLTFDPFGGYGHPDHITIHRATVLAFQMAREGLLPADEQPKKLYYTTFPRALLRLLVYLMPLVGRDPKAAGKNKDINLVRILEHELPVTTRIDVSLYYHLREQAGACHSSQLAGPSSISGWLPKWLVRRLRRIETFHRAIPVFAKGERLERDLFAGIQACP